MFNEEESKRLKLIEEEIGLKIPIYYKSDYETGEECFYKVEDQYISEIRLKSKIISHFPEYIPELLNLKKIDL